MPRLQKPAAETVEWADYPQLVQQLSAAVVDAMRHMMTEILATEIWFEEMDVSVMNAGHEVLSARITHFHLTGNPGGHLFGQWQIFRTNQRNFEYVNTVEFGATADTSTLLVAELVEQASDSIFFDVHKSPVRFVPETEGLSDITVVFWREKRKKDKIISLRMNRRKGERFSVLTPTL